MNWHFQIFSAVLLILGSAVAAQEVTHVGSNKGRFTVSSAGEASFTIKIPVPPGIQDQQPNLSFNYSSGMQNGLMGVGWSLSGFPKIARVKQIIAIDGVAGDIRFANTDRFALGGQRLLVMTGQNGADGATYRTEIDSWKKVISTGTVGNGPEQFTVTRPDGTIMVFGGSTDARPTSKGGTVREWLVSQMTDRNGNTMAIRYSTDPTGMGSANAQTYPVEIAYGTNVDGPAAADRFVKFTYETRPDPYRHFLAGTEVATDLRLSAVSTFLGTDLVAQYRLSYEISASNGRSRLISVQRFASADANAEGLSPTEFAYSDGANAFDGGSTWIATAFTANSGWDAADNPVTLADVNGDGLSDIIGFKSGTQVALATGSDFAPPTTWISNFSPEFNWTADQPRYLADINGDGLADIVGFSTNGVITALADAANDRFIQQPGIFAFFAPNNGWDTDAPRYLADVNGDKALDIVGFNDGVLVALANDQGSFDIPTSWNANYGLRQGFAAANVLLADVNGDGKSDVVAMNQQTRTVNVALSTGSAFSESGWDQSYQSFAANAQWGPDNPRMFSDVNGDGLADIIGFSSDVQVGLSNGAGFEPPETWSTGFGAPNWDQTTPRMLMDVNADGLADIVATAQNNVQIALSTGAAFQTGSWNQASLNQLGLASGGPASQTTRTPVDVNADGLTDLVGFTASGVVVGLVAGNYPDLLTTFIRGSGGQVAVAYKPISDPSVYSETPGEGALAKFQFYRPINQNSSLPVYRSASRLAGHFYVVATNTSTNNPAIADRAFSYKASHRYRDGASSNLGRGWLGFGSSIHTNVSMGRTTTLTYNQKFPLIGRLASKSLTCATGATVCDPGDIYHEDFFDYVQTVTETSVTTGFKAQMVHPKSIRSDRYQGATYQHSLGQTFLYDTFGNRTQQANLNLVTQKGVDIDPSDNLYRNASFSGDTSNWFLSYPLYQKTSASGDLTGIETFVSGTDLSLTKHSYGAEMNQVAVAEWDQDNAVFVSNGFSFDGFGNRLSQTTANGATTDYTVDGTYNTYELTQTSPPNTAGLKLTTRYGYDPRFGTRSLRVDPNGNQLVTCYDEFGRRALIQGPLPAGADASLKAGLCLGSRVILPGGYTPQTMADLIRLDHAWENGIATVRRTTLQSWETQDNAPQTQLTVTYFDGMDRDYRRITQAEDGSLTRVLQDDTYNAMNKPVVSLLPYFTPDTAPDQITITYDPLDRMIANTAPWTTGGGLRTVNSATSYSVTAQGESSARIEAQGTPYESTITTEQGYFANDTKPVSVSYQDTGAANDPALSTSMDRDLLGRVTVLSPPGATGATPVALTCAATPGGAGPNTAIRALYAYDSLGRICARSLPSIGTIKLSFGTDGLMSNASRNNGTTSFSYDALGRRLTTSYPGGIAVALSYDNATAGDNGLGRLAAAKVTGQAQDVARRYAYDAYGNNVSSALTVGAGATLTTTTAFDPVGRPVAQTLPDGTTVATGYSFGNLVSQSIAGTTQLAASDFTAFGQPQTLSFGNGVTSAITYGAAFHVASIATKSGAATLWSETYDRDPFGYVLGVTGTSGKWASYSRTLGYGSQRLTSATDTRLSGNAQSFSYDVSGNLTALGDLTAVPDGFQLAQGSTFGGAALNPTYDTMGNLTGAGATALSFANVFDGRNRMTSTIVASGSAAFAYDHTGARVWRRDTSGVEYLYSSPRYSLVNAAGAATSRIVLHGAMGPAYLAENSGGTIQSQRYLHTDDRNSVVVETDTGGAATDYFLYGPYGLVEPGGTSMTPVFGFQGRRYDADTGLYYYSARYYDPRLGRFTRADTQFGASPTRPDAANRYAYMLNNPAIGFDPSGHGLLGCLIAVGGGVGSATAGGVNVYLGIKNGNVAQAAGVGGGGAVGGAVSIIGGIIACRRGANVERRLQALERQIQQGPEDDEPIFRSYGTMDERPINRGQFDDDPFLSDDEEQYERFNPHRQLQGRDQESSDDADDELSENDADGSPDDIGGSEASGSGSAESSEAVVDADPLGSAVAGDAEAGVSELSSGSVVDSSASVTLGSSSAVGDAAANSSTAITGAASGEAAGLEASTAAATDAATSIGVAEATGTAISSAAEATTAATAAATTEIATDTAIAVVTTTTAAASTDAAAGLGFLGFLALIFL